MNKRLATTCMTTLFAGYVLCTTHQAMADCPGDLPRIRIPGSYTMDHPFEHGIRERKKILVSGQYTFPDFSEGYESGAL